MGREAPVSRKVIALLGLLLFPALICLNVWQSYRFQQLEETLVQLQEEQVELLEKNKRALAALAVYSSPSRVGSLAEEQLELGRISGDKVIHVVKGGR